MMNLVKGFLKDEDGMGTVEIVVIIAVLVSIALIFRNVITNWVRTTIDKILNQDANTKVENQ